MGICGLQISSISSLPKSLILRQTETFSIQDVCLRIKDKATGSSLDNLEEINKRCLETISALYLIDCIRNTGENEYKLTMTFPSTSK